MLAKLQLENFRNHKRLELDFNQITIITGANGAGKTNIIEAIRFISLLKSFRARNQAELVCWGQQAARVIAKVSDTTIEAAISPTQKILKINGVKKLPTQLFGQLKTSLFSPDDVTLFTGPPVLRRRFLDSLLAQHSRQFLITLGLYQQVLRRRNALLTLINHNQASVSDLAVWDEQLVELAVELHRSRTDLVLFTNQRLGGFHSEVSGSKTQLLLKPLWSDLTIDKLQDVLPRDIVSGATTIGPHHDDLRAILGDKDLGRFGSRGENRSAVFALKLVELDYLTAQRDPPVLLLDDIFSELDHARRERLQQLLTNYQTIITTTDEHYISPDLRKRAKIIELT